jgi:hypothetical protein
VTASYKLIQITKLCVRKRASRHISGCSVVSKIKTSIHPYVKVKHHLQMSLTLNNQVPSYFIIQAAVCGQGSCSHLSTSWCIFKHCIFFIEILGTNSGIVFDDKEHCHQKDNKKRAFEDAEFSQSDVAKMDDDRSWLRQNDSFVPMSDVTQSTNSYVFNPTISLGEIPNVCEDFRTPRKRITGANANNVGKLS